MHKQLKRIEDYQKTLGVLELYTAVQSEGSRQGYPTIVVRTSGCTHRCYFGEGGWCDSWYTSIHPEKGTYCFQDIKDMYDKAGGNANNRTLPVWYRTKSETPPSDPGTHGTPSSLIVSLAVILSPIMRICSAVGPINFIP